MAKAVYSRAAVADLKTIARYIAQDNPERSGSFVHEIRVRCGKRADFPMSGQSRPDIAPGMRSFAHGAYVVLYMPLEDGISVVRVIHSSRDIRAAL
ncbi:type II toxin-antitoxin system RelE/ParE family toxin [Rhodospirillum sp. A1_3_36]|uniref:type II toxin-antitoxin system RelE/ParE family toxin n=1 Tax=Rhodospirillum sp. A1_3_36 TaxID=3391666 RepID=UPI0039A49977